MSSWSRLGSQAMAENLKPDPNRPYFAVLGINICVIL
jgi:hypothetical protein